MKRPAQYDRCRLCKAELKPHERAEPECDECLRKHQPTPSLPRAAKE